MKSIVSKLTMVAVLLVSIPVSPFHASAQISQANKEMLKEVSRIRLIDGNSCFLLAEMLKDGLLQESEQIDMQYNDKKVTLNGKDIPEPYNSRYIQMLKNGGWLQYGGTGSVRAGGETISALARDTSSTRGYGRSYPQNYRRLVNLLVVDGIAGSADNVTIDIAADYVAVNGRILTTPVEKAYEYHFRELSGFKPKEGEVFSIVMKHTSKN